MARLTHGSARHMYRDLIPDHEWSRDSCLLNGCFDCCACVASTSGLCHECMDDFLFNNWENWRGPPREYEERIDLSDSQLLIEMENTETIAVEDNQWLEIQSTWTEVSYDIPDDSEGNAEAEAEVEAEAESSTKSGAVDEKCKDDPVSEQEDLKGK